METLRDVIDSEGLRAAVNPKRFNVAGIILTYQCTAACRHCLFACSPARPPVVMAAEDCVEALRAYSRLPRVVHIAGGECFLFYERMLEICRAARREGVAPHFVETNASWCASDEITERRLSALRDAGVLGVLISADPYHQEFIPAERAQRCARIAARVFGEQNVLGYEACVRRSGGFVGLTRDEQALRDHVRKHPPEWMAGSAYRHLAKYLDCQPLEAFAAVRCERLFDLERVWEFHFDPYGNLQTNCGVVLGNTRSARPLDLLDQERVWANPIVKVLSRTGPVGLLRLAAERGLAPRDGYVHKCEVCFHARSFLRPHFRHILCPDEVYTP